MLNIDGADDGSNILKKSQTLEHWRNCLLVLFFLNVVGVALDLISTYCSMR